MAVELDLAEERREAAQLRLAAYQARTARFYNKKVIQRRFRTMYLVLRKVIPNTKPKNVGSLGPKWEGPYWIQEARTNGSYLLETLEGKSLDQPWNAEHLKAYFN